MPPQQALLHNRRKFLSYLAGSPLLLGQQISDVITDPSEALNVFDFEAAARKVLPPAHFGYMATGVEDDLTLKANRDGFSRIYLPASPTDRHHSSRHENGDLRRDVGLSDRLRDRLETPKHSIRRAKSRPPAPPRQRSVCRFFLPRPILPSKMWLRFWAVHLGISSTSHLGSTSPRDL